MVAVVSVSITPWATCVGRVPSRRTRPHPRCRVPGSIPRTITGAPSSARAVPECRKDLAGVQEALGIERGLQPLLKVDERVGLLEREVRRLGETDAVLARQRAAHRHHAAKKLLDRSFDLVRLLRIVP